VGVRSIVSKGAGANTPSRGLPSEVTTDIRWQQPTEGGTVMAEAAATTKPDTIVLIHGFWVTPRSWEHWKKHYEAKGYTVLTPAYPGFEVEVEALRADPTPIE